MTERTERISTASDLRDRLRAAGLRATSARVTVLKCLEASKVPLTHAEVYDQVAADGFDRATVYRNLIDLADVGFLKRYDLGDHVWRFELLRAGADGKSTHGGEAHPHFVCSDCGTVECLPSATVSLSTSRGGPKSLRKATELEIQIRGLCNECG
jgi:Fur family ferric uptake transcriptional regulator